MVVPWFAMACLAMLPVLSSQFSHIASSARAAVPNDTVIWPPQTLPSDRLHRAVLDGDFARVTSLLRAGHDANVLSGPTLVTPLHQAARRGDLAIAELLVSYGGRIDQRDANGNTPLHTAALGNHAAVVSFLLQRGAGVDALNAYGKSPLHKAAMEGSLEAVQTLVAHHAQVDRQDGDGRTALHLAAKAFHANVVRLLLRNGANPRAGDRWKLPPLNMTLEQEWGPPYDEKIRTASALIRAADLRGKELDAVRGARLSTRTLLHVAASTGDLDFARMLLERGADPNFRKDDGQTPVFFAATYGHAAMVELLASQGARMDVKDADGLTALAWAIRVGHMDVARVLHRLGVPVDIFSASALGLKEWVNQFLAQHPDAVKALGPDDGCTPLHYAAGGGDAPTTALLLEKGADIRAHTTSGLTPLHVASHWGHADLVRFLLSKGAEVNAPANDRHAPLHSAARSDRVAVVQVLLTHGAPIDQADTDGRTALHDAAFWGSANSLKLLIRSGANVSARGKWGTPLHEAFRWPFPEPPSEGRRKCVHALVKAGANVNEPDENGDTLLHLAMRNGGKEAVEMLLRLGADPDLRNAAGKTPLEVAPGDLRADLAEIVRRCSRK